MKLLEMFNNDDKSNYHESKIIKIKCMTKDIIDDSPNIKLSIVNLINNFIIDEKQYTNVLADYDIDDHINTWYYIYNVLKPHKIIGIIDIRNSMMTPNATEISMLYVNKEYRNNEYGKKLLDFAKYKACESDKPIIVARVFKSNPAVEIYKKCGYNF